MACAESSHLLGNLGELQRQGHKDREKGLRDRVARGHEQIWEGWRLFDVLFGGWGLGDGWIGDCWFPLVPSRRGSYGRRHATCFPSEVRWGQQELPREGGNGAEA
jgi:hypothetical protein